MNTPRLPRSLEDFSLLDELPAGFSLLAVALAVLAPLIVAVALAV